MRFSFRMEISARRSRSASDSCLGDILGIVTIGNTLVKYDKTICVGWVFRTKFLFDATAQFWEDALVVLDGVWGDLGHEIGYDGMTDSSKIIFNDFGFLKQVID